jgi:hypothetical protein
MSLIRAAHYKKKNYASKMNMFKLKPPRDRSLLECLSDPLFRLMDCHQRFQKLNQLTKCFLLQVALLCIHTVIALRPSMRQCIAMLQGEMEIRTLPPRPMTLFTIGQMATGHSSSRSRGSMTFTRMDSVRESSLDAENGSMGSLEIEPHGQTDIAEAGVSLELAEKH